jgi:hypothetical protein
MPSHSDFYRLAQDKGVPVQAGTPFFIQKNIRKHLISLMFFMLAQHGTTYNVYEHDVRTHTCARNNRSGVGFSAIPPVPPVPSVFEPRSA